MGKLRAETVERFEVETIFGEGIEMMMGLEGWRGKWEGLGRRMQ